MEEHIELKVTIEVNGGDSWTNIAGGTIYELEYTDFRVSEDMGWVGLEFDVDEVQAGGNIKITVELTNHDITLKDKVKIVSSNTDPMYRFGTCTSFVKEDYSKSHLSVENFAPTT